jgi:hypothetical protein
MKCENVMQKGNVTVRFYIKFWWKIFTKIINHNENFIVARKQLHTCNWWKRKTSWTPQMVDAPDNFQWVKSWPSTSMLENDVGAVYRSEIKFIVIWCEINWSFGFMG